MFYDPITFFLLIVNSNHQFSFLGALRILLDVQRFVLGVQFCPGVWGNSISGWVTSGRSAWTDSCISEGSSTGNSGGSSENNPGGSFFSDAEISSFSSFTRQFLTWATCLRNTLPSSRRSLNDTGPVCSTITPSSHFVLPVKFITYTVSPTRSVRSLACTLWDSTCFCCHWWTRWTMSGCIKSRCERGCCPSNISAGDNHVVLCGIFR